MDPGAVLVLPTSQLLSVSACVLFSLNPRKSSMYTWFGCMQYVRGYHRASTSNDCATRNGNPSTNRAVDESLNKLQTLPVHHQY
eukprot:jgi/Psemu1/8008/gm1.8008_g